MITVFVVDAQLDFMPGGALAVTDGDAIIPTVNMYLNRDDVTSVVFSKDFHPINHTSFAVNHGAEPFTVVNGEMKWTVHCVNDQKGSEIHPDIKTDLGNIKTLIVLKGTDPNREEYSGATPDAISFIEASDSEIVVVLGLATDYCVKATALDLKRLTSKKILVDLLGCRGVAPETTAQAITEMKEAGIEII
jgi:nicotinamidase/pyrazinamidase